eukprot:TRINITY_DN239_c0_g1_i1.p1 TRINITY_DN239_c0_g1~~TRINITY_DN239_c0_g1_i1.p1  ORF type:complete len:109 (+),score=1.97 TRINITY_DN239_c0_g1_i1:33-359(+)
MDLYRYKSWRFKISTILVFAGIASLFFSFLSYQKWYFWVFLSIGLCLVISALAFGLTVREKNAESFNFEPNENGLGLRVQTLPLETTQLNQNNFEGSVGKVLPETKCV